MSSQQLLLAGGSAAVAGPVLLAHTGSSSGAPAAVTTSAIDTTGATFLIMTGSKYVSVLTITDSKGNTWVKNEFGDNSGSNAWYAVCYSPTVGSGHTFTATPVGNYYGTVQVMAFSGITASSVNTEGGTTGASSTTFQSGAFTPGVANTLMIAIFAADTHATGTISIDNSYTITETVAPVVDTNFESSAAYKVLTSSTAQNPTWTCTASIAYATAAIVGFAY